MNKIQVNQTHSGVQGGCVKWAKQQDQVQWGSLSVSSYIQLQLPTSQGAYLLWPLRDPVPVSHIPQRPLKRGTQNNTTSPPCHPEHTNWQRHIHLATGTLSQCCTSRGRRGTNRNRVQLDMTCTCNEIWGQGIRPYIVCLLPLGL